VKGTHHRKQRGITTLLTLILIGLALTVAVMGATRQLRSQQEQSIALHSQTIAQARAWTAAEVLREYLHQQVLDTASWDAFRNAIASESSVAVDMGNFDGVTASLSLGPEDPANPSYRLVTAQIVAKAVEDTRAESTSTLEAVYHLNLPVVTGGNGSDGEPDTRAINFKDGLNVGGNIGFITLPGQSYDINVEGNVYIGSLSVDGIGAIRSTGSVHICGGGSGQQPISLIHASCDVDIRSFTVSVDTIKATRNVSLYNHVSTNLLVANGTADIVSGTHNNIYAHDGKSEAGATCVETPPNNCPGSSSPSFTGIRTFWGTKVNGGLYSKGNIDPTGSSANSGKFSIGTEGLVNGQACTPNSNYECVAPQMEAPVPPVTVEPEVFDVNTLRNMANYIFSYDGNNIRVKVKGLEDIPDTPEQGELSDGYYLMYDIKNVPSNGWICKKQTFYANNKEECPAKITWYTASGNQPVIHPPATSSSCSSSGAFCHNWRLSGNSPSSIAPGIAFFEGSLTLNLGRFTNTFIATGDIHVTTGGSWTNTVFALNYAGPDGITKVSGMTAIGVCDNNHYSTVTRPKDFCTDKGYNHKAHNGIGNYALLAGSCPEGSQNGCSKESYIGGKITTEKHVFGAIKAGDLFEGGQDTHIYGYVSSLGQGSRRTTLTTNKMGNTTRIYLDVPTERQDIYDPSGGLGADSSPPQPGSAVLRWTRYL